MEFPMLVSHSQCIPKFHTSPNSPQIFRRFPLVAEIPHVPIVATWHPRQPRDHPRSAPWALWDPHPTGNLPLCSNGRVEKDWLSETIIYIECVLLIITHHEESWLLVSYHSHYIHSFIFCLFVHTYIHICISYLKVMSRILSWQCQMHGEIALAQC